MPRLARKVTLFSFGYWGWGNSTPKLVEAADAIERCRGFRPPIFVDIRIRRTVRAVGFNGNAFGDLLGEKRYRWMRALGNRQIVMKSGPGIQIDEPKAANELLGLAAKAAEDRRRVIFFCACPWPRWEGKVSCHRTVVANLVLAAARRRGINVEVVEWPGGDPLHIEFALDSAMFDSVVKGRMMIPLPHGATPAALGGPAWGSIATLQHGDQEVHRGVGPAVWHNDEWCLPVSWFFNDAGVDLPSYEKKSLWFVKSAGLGPRRSLSSKPPANEPTMKALSIRQPHAEAIIRGMKKIEYRSRPTHIRGRIYIYAARGRSSATEATWMKKYGIADVSCDDLPRGVLIGTVDLWKCTGKDGCYRWHVRNPVRAKRLLKPKKRPQPAWFNPF